MKITGHKKLMRQLGDLPKETHKALEKSVSRTVNLGVRKAKAIVPVDSGELKEGINGYMHQKDGQIYGFVNFTDGTKEDAIKVGAVNYGRKNARSSAGTRLKATASTGQTSGYQFIETVKLIIGDRHRRAVTRNINKAIKDAMNG